MKVIANTILLLLFIPLFLIAFFAGVVKTKILVPTFWQKTFTTNETYSKLSIAFKTYQKGGTDTKILTDLITSENIQEFVDRNLISVLNYANGKSPEILVYIPINKLPKGFLPENLAGIKEEIPLSVFLSDFNIGVSKDQVQWVSLVGKTTTYLLILAASLAAVCLILLFVLAEPGKRFIFPGVALLISGISVISIWSLGNNFAVSLTGDLVNSPPLDKQIIEIVIPPVLHSVFSIWLWIGAGLAIIGVILFFLKKPIRKERPVV